MQGSYLKIYVPEALRHHGIQCYEWILQQAHVIGVPGGSAVRAAAGYGRHGRLHEQHFFELAGEVPMLVEFFASADAIDRLLALLRTERISVFYVRLAAEGGVSDASE